MNDDALPVVYAEHSHKPKTHKLSSGSYEKKHINMKLNDKNENIFCQTLILLYAYLVSVSQGHESKNIKGQKTVASAKKNCLGLGYKYF